MNTKRKWILSLCILIGVTLHAQNIEGPSRCKTCGKLLKECPYHGNHEKAKDEQKANDLQHIEKAKQYYRQGKYSKASDELYKVSEYNGEWDEIRGDIEYYYMNPFSSYWYSCYSNALEKGRSQAKDKLFFDVRHSNFNYTISSSTAEECEKINYKACETTDASEKLRLFRTASDMGSQRASFNLGRMYELGKETTQDYKEAFRLFEFSKGFTPSALHLAWLYRHGLGVEKNEVKSFEIYSSLIDKTKNDISLNTYALYNTAICYENGIGTTKNINKAFEYYRQILDRNKENVSLNCIELASIRYAELIYEKQMIDTFPPTGNYYMNLFNYYASSHYIYHIQKKQKITETQRKALLGNCLENASKYDIINKDWQNTIGNHFKDKGNYDEAIKWYRKGAQNGASTSCWNLGDCYEHGLGVEQNYEEAMKWYVKAKELGNGGANMAIERLKKKGVSVK